MARQQEFEAVAEGAKRAVMQAIRDATDMPGEDTFHFIKEGVKEAAREWFDANRKEVLDAISRAAGGSASRQPEARA